MAKPFGDRETKTKFWDTQVFLAKYATHKAAWSVWCVLYRHRNYDTGISRASYATIEERTGFSGTTISATLHELLRLGVLGLVNLLPNQKVTEYYLLSLETDWVPGKRTLRDLDRRLKNRLGVSITGQKHVAAMKPLEED